jgi:membrane protein DedA with SNARE-associated domain
LWDEPLFVGLSIVAGFLWSPVFFYVGIYFSVRALWYWMALRWVDKHDAW